MNHVERGRIKWNLHERINARGYCQRLNYLLPVRVFGFETHILESQIDIAQDPYFISHWTMQALKYVPRMKKFKIKPRHH